jgi:GT2 family glycosyltransferase
MTIAVEQTGLEQQSRAFLESQPQVSIVILNWNTRDLTLQCLDSLKQTLGELSAQIIVVDNYSSDGSADTIAALHPDVTLVRSGSNLGFARGNNLGFRSAQGKYLVMLNSDTIVLPGAVQRLVQYLEEHPQIAVAGGQHLNRKKDFVPSGLRFPSLWIDLGVALGMNKFGPLMLRKNLKLARFWYTMETQEVDWLSNSFVAFRKELFDRVGPLPEEFFLYGEDVEWYWRIREAGLRVAYVHGAPIIHFENESSQQLYQNDKYFRYLDGFYTFARRHRNPLTWRLGWLAKAMHWSLMGLRWRIRALWTKDKTALEQAHWLLSFARYHVDQVLGRVAPLAF